MKTHICLLLASLMLASAAVAKEPPPSFKPQSAQEFSEASAELQKQMEKGGRFEFLDAKEHQQIVDRLQDMQHLFAQYGSVEGMNQNAKVQLLNDQEEVNALLKHRDADRLVCDNSAPTGSHISRTSCKTYREIQQEQKATDQWFRQVAPQPQMTRG